MCEAMGVWVWRYDDDYDHVCVCFLEARTKKRCIDAVYFIY